MTKFDKQYDVLILGGHPCAYLLGILLRENAGLSVLHCSAPAEAIGGPLVFLNPAFFDLHPDLKSLRRKIDSSAVYGLHFLGNNLEEAGEYRERSIVGLVGSFSDLHQALAKIAKDRGILSIIPDSVQIQRDR